VSIRGPSGPLSILINIFLQQEVPQSRKRRSRHHKGLTINDARPHCRPRAWHLLLPTHTICKGYYLPCPLLPTPALTLPAKSRGLSRAGLGGLGAAQPFPKPGPSRGFWAELGRNNTMLYWHISGPFRQ
jgi:hypothetical protein